MCEKYGQAKDSNTTPTEIKSDALPTQLNDCSYPMFHWRSVRNRKALDRYAPHSIHGIASTVADASIVDASAMDASERKGSLIIYLTLGIFIRLKIKSVTPRSRSRLLLAVE